MSVSLEKAKEAKKSLKKEFKEVAGEYPTFHGLKSNGIGISMEKEDYVVVINLLNAEGIQRVTPEDIRKLPAERDGVAIKYRAMGQITFQ